MQLGSSLERLVPRWSSISIEGTQDGGKSWARLAARSSMLGNGVATYGHQGAFGTTAGVRLTHLRGKASRAGKGAVRVGLDLLRL